ncbi:MAG: hypothetical protein IJN38_08685 [Clostridia bacterium]|nr:hypothetical protein [Clostridia bacterium]
MRRAIKIIIIVLATVIPLTIGWFAYYIVISGVELQKPYVSTSVEELKFYSPFFDDVEMESCKFVWKGTVVFMGGVLEAQVCGRADLTDEYYEKITQEYEWKKSTIPDNDYSDYKDVEILTDFLQNNEYYISDDYCYNAFMWVYLSKEEKALYFYDMTD